MAKGAYGVFLSEEMMKDFKRVFKLKALNNAGDGSFQLYYQADLEVLAREHDEIVLYTRHSQLGTSAVGVLSQDDLVRRL